MKGTNQLLKEILETDQMENKLVEPEALHRNEVTNETEKIGKYYQWKNQ